MRFFRSSTILLILLTSCIEPYEPTLRADTFNILVVDGFINTTNSSATVRLSRAVPVSENTPPVQDIIANVNIEDDAGTTFTLNDNGHGYFSLENMTLDPSKKYRVHIYSQSDDEFFSDYVELITSPPIDSVIWRSDGDGLSVYVNTHDPLGKSRYYTWSYHETWEYTASFFSTYKMVDGVAFPRPPEESIYRCWSSYTSTKILIGSSERLSEDVIRDFPLVFIPGASSKIARRYSILVEQRVLSKEAYDFWLELEKTTESLGGLFDPMPSQVIGNIRSSNPNAAEPVLGYFSGGSAPQQRIFIDFVDLPANILSIPRPRYCTDNDVATIFNDVLPTLPNSVLLIDPIYSQAAGAIVAYTTAANACIDCRVFGGTTIRPDFW